MVITHNEVLQARRQNHIYEDSYVTFDRLAHVCHCQGETINLTPMEWGILDCLVTHRGQACRSVDLATFIYGADPSPFEQSNAKWHIANLRKKLGGSCPITTLRGYGYRWDG